ncbi:MAG: hypothetical protein ACP5D6_06480 [Kosmotogaceae bacterium]
MEKQLYLVIAQLFRNTSIGYEVWVEARDKSHAVDRAYHMCPKEKLLELKSRSTWVAMNYDKKEPIDWETISIALDIIEKGFVLIENAIPHYVENEFAAEFYNVFLQSFGKLVHILPKENK